MFVKPSVNFEFENLIAKKVQWLTVRLFWKNYSWTRVFIRMISVRCWWIWSFWVYKRWEIDNITYEYFDQILRSTFVWFSDGKFRGIFIISLGKESSDSKKSLRWNHIRSVKWQFFFHREVIEKYAIFESLHSGNFKVLILIRMNLTYI